MPRKKRSDEDEPLSIKQASADTVKSLFSLLARNDPGSVFPCLKRVRKASDPYALKLTLRERESLIASTQLKGKLKKKLQDAGEGTQVFEITHRELTNLNAELVLAVAYAEAQRRRRLVAVLRKVANLMVEDYTGLFVQVSVKTRKMAAKKATRNVKK